MTVELPWKPQPETPQPTAAKKFISPEKSAAARTNGARSRGAVSPEGRAAIKFNAVTLGLTCKEIVFLPGESPEDFYNEVKIWEREQGAVTKAEKAQIKTAVYTDLKKQRARNAEAHAEHKLIEDINEGFYDRQAAEVRDLIPLLLENPGAVVSQLKNLTLGCEWLLSQWDLVSERLITHTSLEGTQRGFAISLTGRHPADLYRDSAIMDWNRAFLGGLRGPGGFTPAEAAELLENDRPWKEIPPLEFRDRLEPVLKEVPSIEKGHALLKTYIAKEVADLIDRHDLLGLREARDRMRAIGLAQADVTPDGVKRSRYTAMIDREHHASLKELRALKAERRKYGEGELDGSHRPDQPVASEPVDVESAEKESTAVTEPEEIAPTALSEPAQNEPTVSQVVDGSGGSKAEPAATESTAGNAPVPPEMTAVTEPAENAPTALSAPAQNEPTVSQVIDSWVASKSAAPALEVAPGGSGAIIAAEHADLEADYQRLIDTLEAQLGVVFPPDGPTRNWRRE